MHREYKEALDYLSGLAKFGVKLGLERIAYLLDVLGNPQKSLSFLHVGGTNGKGSTAAMASNMLQEAGYRVGLFTSPHLTDYCERVMVNSRKISPEDLTLFLARLKPLMNKMVREGYEHPTEFEVLTALAILYFHKEQVDLAVLEVGLGGEYDATNVVTPLVSIITNIGKDHLHYLGKDLKKIARAKAGIIKQRGMVVTAAEQASVLEVFEETCCRQAAKLFRVGRDITWKLSESSTQGQRFHLWGLKEFYPNLESSLIGEHQMVNAATAVGAVELLSLFGFPVSETSIRQGLRQTRWPGRLEVLSREPTILIDAAHNYSGALSLRKALGDLFRYRHLIFVLGMLPDKERDRVGSLLAPLASAVVVTKPRHPLASDWKVLATVCKCFTDDVYVIEELALALEKALSLAQKEDLVCITGSFYIIGEARELIKNIT